MRERQYASALATATVAGLTASSDTTTLLATLAAGAQAADDRITDTVYDRNNRATKQARLNVAIADVNATTGGLTENTVSTTLTTQYNGLGKITQQTDSQSNVTNWTYDGLGRQTKEELPSFVDYLGATVRTTTETRYDGLGNIRSQTQKGATLAEDRTSGYEYNANGHLISQTDAMGNQTLYGVDLLGNVTRKQISRLQANNTTVTDTTVYRYDGRNQQAYQLDLSTSTTQETVYSAYGEVVAKKTNGVQTEFAEYNQLGKVWRTNAQGGMTKATLYDANGNATLTLESAGANLSTMTLAQMLASTDVKPTITVYDARNQVVDVQQPQLTFTHETPAIESVQVVQPGSTNPFEGGRWLFRREI